MASTKTREMKTLRTEALRRQVFDWICRSCVSEWWVAQPDDVIDRGRRAGRSVT